MSEQTKVDVLAVMDAAYDRLPDHVAAPLYEARAAVAELIEAAKVVADGTTMNGYNGADMDRLWIALARCGGAS